jgi:hypothetical protein
LGLFPRLPQHSNPKNLNGYAEPPRNWKVQDAGVIETALCFEQHIAAQILGAQVEHVEQRASMPFVTQGQTVKSAGLPRVLSGYG